MIHRSGTSVEKWRVEFASSGTDCHPVKLACQLTASNLLDASSVGMYTHYSRQANEIKTCFPSYFLFIRSGEDEAVGERVYSVEHFLSQTHKLL